MQMSGCVWAVIGAWHWRLQALSSRVWENSPAQDLSNWVHVVTRLIKRPAVKLMACEWFVGHWCSLASSSNPRFGLLLLFWWCLSHSSLELELMLILKHSRREWSCVASHQMQKKHLVYYTFSEMLCLNMQMRHSLICTHFQNIHLIIG